MTTEGVALSAMTAEGVALSAMTREAERLDGTILGVHASKKDGVLYTGVTNNLAVRVMQHRRGKGSKFAKKYWALRLVYAQPFEDVNEAISAEKRLKKWRRIWKVELIERENPDWRDLMEDRG